LLSIDRQDQAEYLQARYSSNFVPVALAKNAIRNTGTYKKRETTTLFTECPETSASQKPDIGRAVSGFLAAAFGRKQNITKKNPENS